MKQLIVEFIGTFFLVLIIALTGNPLAIGIGLMALVYMGGYISGANYNPAVTVALIIIGKMNLKTAAKYIFTQLFGGLSAAGLYYLLSLKYFTPQPALNASISMSLIIEILFTFLLVSVVLHTAVSHKIAGNDYYGLAIGACVIAIAFAGGPISGAVYNPAVALGPILFNYQSLAANAINLLIYILGPLSGGILAGLVYKNLIHS